MDTLLLGELVATAGLIGAIAAYAGLLRRRSVVREAIRAANAAMARVARLRVLDRVRAGRKWWSGRDRRSRRAAHKANSG